MDISERKFIVQMVADLDEEFELAFMEEIIKKRIGILEKKRNL